MDETEGQGQGGGWGQLLQQFTNPDPNQPVQTPPVQTPPAQVPDVAVPPPDAPVQAVVTPGAGEIAVPDLDQYAALMHGPDFLSLLAVFVLAIFVGYYVVWHVTPALHSPLMAVTNAISSVIIVGALVAAGMAVDNVSTVFGFLAVILASVNIFGGFLVTRRMLSMFRKKPR